MKVYKISIGIRIVFWLIFLILCGIPISIIIFSLLGGVPIESFIRLFVIFFIVIPIMVIIAVAIIQVLAFLLCNLFVNKKVKITPLIWTRELVNNKIKDWAAFFLDYKNLLLGVPKIIVNSEGMEFESGAGEWFGQTSGKIRWEHIVLLSVVKLWPLKRWGGSRSFIYYKMGFIEDDFLTMLGGNKSWEIGYSQNDTAKVAESIPIMIKHKKDIYFPSCDFTYLRIPNIKWFANYKDLLREIKNNSVNLYKKER